MKTRLVILDFDGTIGDTRSVIVRTIQQTITRMGLPRRGDDECAATIGLTLEDSFGRLFGIGAEERRQCAATYRELFAQNNKPGAVPVFPHVIDTMRRLKAEGKTLTIASSRGHESLDGFVREMNLGPLVSLVLGADDIVKAKPDPEPVLKTLAQTGFSAAETLVVGDTEYDILMGRRTGAATCGVTYGNGTRQQLEQAGADYVVDDFARLAEIA